MCLAREFLGRFVLRRHRQYTHTAKKHSSREFLGKLNFESRRCIFILQGANKYNLTKFTQARTRKRFLGRFVLRRHRQYTHTAKKHSSREFLGKLNFESRHCIFILQGANKYNLTKFTQARTRKRIFRKISFIPPTSSREFLGKLDFESRRCIFILRGANKYNLTKIHRRRKKKSAPRLDKGAPSFFILSYENNN